jgi:hypothetical protein
MSLRVSKLAELRGEAPLSRNLTQVGFGGVKGPGAVQGDCPP